MSVHNIDAGHEVMITKPGHLAAIVTPILADADRAFLHRPGLIDFSPTVAQNRSVI